MSTKFMNITKYTVEPSKVDTIRTTAMCLEYGCIHNSGSSLLLVDVVCNWAVEHNDTASLNLSIGEKG